MVDGRLELIGKVHKHPFLHLADHGRRERPYVIQELGNLLLDAEDDTFVRLHTDGCRTKLYEQKSGELGH